MERTHVLTRVLEREIPSKYVLEAKKWACISDPDKSYAVDLGTEKFHGEAWSDESNGTQVVAVIRHSKVVTLMFRRETQPWTPESLRVDVVIRGQELL